MAGPPSQSDPCPLDLGADVRGPTASRSGRRHHEDPRESQIERQGGAALVRKRARRATARNAPASRVGRPSATGSINAYGNDCIVSCATARPAGSSRNWSTTGPLTRIGATARIRPHWRRTMPPGASWHGPGMPAQAKSMAGRCSGSPSHPSKSAGNPAWEHFPEGLRADLENYWDGLTKPRRSLSDQRIRPCRPATIRASRAALLAMARMAVRQGVPIEKLTSLAALLHPDVVERVIEHTGRRMAMNPKSGPSTSAGNCSGSPARQVAWTKRPSTVSTRSGLRWNIIGDRD